MQCLVPKDSEQLYKIPDGVSSDDLLILFAVYNGPILRAVFAIPGEAEQFVRKYGGWIAIYVPEDEEA